MEGKGTQLTCKACGASWMLDENGWRQGNAEEGTAHIPDWYAWERRAVRQELEAGTYQLDCPVRILVYRDRKAIYDIGKGRLMHDTAGFVGLHDHRVTHILRYGKTQPLVFKHFFSGSAVRRGGFGSFFGLAGGAARGRQDQRGAEKQKK